MLTPQDIHSVEFTKSLGGYKTNEVDDFLDKCADTVSAYIQEKNELTKKLEVLADKLVEYRNEEDNIRTALLSAQKLGDTVVREANHKATLILDDAQIKADKVLDNAKKEIVEEQRELERIKTEVANFKSRLLSIYREHLTLINILDPHDVQNEEEAEAEENQETPVTEQPAQDAEETDNIAEIEPETTDTVSYVEKDAEDDSPAFGLHIAQLEEDGDDAAQAVNNARVPNPFPESTASSRFANLKFGTDYDLSQEKDDDEEQEKGFFRRKK